MPAIREVCEVLEAWAPQRLAEDWDNVGLLVGDLDRPVARIMTCLTVTPESADEAVRERADLIVTHHPLPFRPLNRLTVDTTTGRLLWQIIGADGRLQSTHRVGFGTRRHQSAARGRPGPARDRAAGGKGSADTRRGSRASGATV